MTEPTVSAVLPTQRLSSVLRVGASLGLAGWALVAALPPALFVLAFAPDTGDSRRFIIVAALVPYISAAALFPVNAMIANFLLRRLEQRTIPLSRWLRIGALVLTILSGLSNAAVAGSSRFLMISEQRIGGQLALIWMLTTSTLAFVGAPFLFVALWRLGRMSTPVNLS